jgi:hypothetical protein
MAIIEKKLFTNLYWNKKKHDMVVMGQFSTEQGAAAKIATDEHLVFNRTIPATLQFEINFDIVTEHPEVKTVDAVEKDV